MPQLTVDAGDKLLAFHQAKLLLTRTPAKMAVPPSACTKSKGKAPLKLEEDGEGEEEEDLASVILHNLYLHRPHDHVAIETQPIDDDDDDCEPEYDMIEAADAEWIYDLGDDYESSARNIKRGYGFVRSTAANRKEKVRKRYVNARDHQRAIEHKAYMNEHFQHRKEKSRIQNVIDMSRYNGYNSGYFGNYDDAAVVSPDQKHLTLSGKHLYVLAPHIRNAIMALQFKEVLTPEDYDLLLMLDDTVTKKTLSRAQINAYALVTVTDEHRHHDKQCMICLSGYILGEKLRRLPCQHEFHTHCIDSWLQHSSDRCPLDNLNLKAS